MMRKKGRLKVYNTTAVPMITYGCEVCALKKFDNSSGNEIHKKNSGIHPKRQDQI